MDVNILRKVQAAQLEIAKEIKRVCDENGISYFLDSGSLLGAVRHKGFIPWDDDMDFGMLSDEYEKFIRIAPQKLKKDFFLQTWETDKGYPFAFCKVLKLGTVFIEDVFADGKKRNELYVDIFPYYPFPTDIGLQNKQKRGIQTYKHILMMQTGMKPWMRPNSLPGKTKVWLMYAPFMLLSKFINRERAIEKYKATLDLSNKKESNGYFPAGTSKYGGWVIPSQCFLSYIELPFEGYSFSAPVDYEIYLEKAYGDYMRLPPESERENRHRIVSIKL